MKCKKFEISWKIPNDSNKLFFILKFFWEILKSLGLNSIITSIWVRQYFNTITRSILSATCTCYSVTTIFNMQTCSLFAVWLLIGTSEIYVVSSWIFLMDSSKKLSWTTSLQIPRLPNIKNCCKINILPWLLPKYDSQLFSEIIQTSRQLVVKLVFFCC